MFRWYACARLVDRFFVLFYPSAKLLEDSDLLVGDGAILARTNIEQEVPAHAETVHKRTEQDLRGLIVRVGMLVAPRIVHGHAKFPIFVLWAHHGNALFRRGIVPVALDAGIDDHIRVIRAQEVDDSLRVPGLRALFPVPVEPVEVGLPGLVQFRQLGEVEFLELGPPRWVVFIAHFRPGLVRIIGV